MLREASGEEALIGNFTSSVYLGEATKNFHLLLMWITFSALSTFNDISELMALLRSAKLERVLTIPFLLLYLK